MRLANVTCKKVEEYLTRSQTVVIPVGSIENHGKHMPLGTDTPDPGQNRGASGGEIRRDDRAHHPLRSHQHHHGLHRHHHPGHRRPGHDLTKVTDSLFRYGFRKFVILNGHGGNNKAIETVGMQLHRRGAWLANLNWWLMAGELNPEWKGGHGGAEETAGVMGVDPALIDYDYINEPMDLIDDVAPNMKTTGWGTVDYKGATVVFPREMHNYSGNGWYGKDEPPSGNRGVGSGDAAHLRRLHGGLPHRAGKTGPAQGRNLKDKQET